MARIETYRIIPYFKSVALPTMRKKWGFAKSFGVLDGDYYVATWGNDGNPGTFSEPFATWQRAVDVVAAGERIYIRGGVYVPTAIAVGTARTGVYINGINGGVGNEIEMFAYPGEIPVLDLSSWNNANSQRGFYFNDSDYWHIRGLTVRNVPQVPGQAHSVGYFLGNDNTYIHFENCVAYNIGGCGWKVWPFTTGFCNEINFTNCDAYNNSDPESAPAGGNADGFQITSITNAATNFAFSGCRAWYNSDDGFDFYTNIGVVSIDNCWSYLNGYLDGNGCGYKLGVTNSTLGAIRRRLTRCVASSNKNIGYYQNAAILDMELFNCIAHLNRQGNYFHHGHADIPLIHFANCISYNHTDVDTRTAKNNYTYDTNDWDGGVVVNNADFSSVDPSELIAARPAGGGLPTIRYLALVLGSDLIDAGTDVGLPYHGLAPDLGPFESNF